MRFTFKSEFRRTTTDPPDLWFISAHVCWRIWLVGIRLNPYDLAHASTDVYVHLLPFVVRFRRYSADLY